MNQDEAPFSRSAHVWELQSLRAENAQLRRELRAALEMLEIMLEELETAHALLPCGQMN